ncbi:MAG: YbhB/YbcL family Raf kinase inhibitor-like protein [Actinomycetota bacterium]|nr:YbhB/YbcL family Raf kinase inhibitor-like protein [Actinomycetota bacterium]
MRRVVLLTSICIGLMIAAGCRDDGRTLRPPKQEQDSTISATLPPDVANTEDPTFIDPGDSLSVTIPPVIDDRTATAPWRDGQAIDARYTCEGDNVSPALAWTDAPDGTVEIAISMTDLDAPQFVHWVIAGISPEAIALNEDTVPIGAYEATNGNGDLGYTGPCPPAGSTHSYVITVHYLGAATGLDDGTPGADLMLAIESVQTASAEVAGTFSRT